MQTFTFKPALLRAPRSYAVDEKGLTCTARDGKTLFALDWADMTGAALVDQVVGRNHIRRFELMRKGGGKAVIAQTGPRRAVPGDPDVAAYLDLVTTVLTRMAERDESLTVQVGSHGAARMSMFAVGVLSLLGGAGLGIAMLATGVSLDRMEVAAMPLLFMLALGGFTVYGNWPWRPVPSFPVGELARRLGDGADSV